MNGDLESFLRKMSLDRGVRPEFTWRDWGNLWKTSVRISGVPVYTLSEHLPRPFL
jgi:hypothetical protein